MTVFNQLKSVKFLAEFLYFLYNLTGKILIIQPFAHFLRVVHHLIVLAQEVFPGVGEMGIAAARAAGGARNDGYAQRLFKILDGLPAL